MEYSEKVLEHFMHPKNMGEMEKADAVATEGSPACGDQVKIFLKIEQKDGQRTISDISFLSYGCASNIATASMITQMAKGKTIKEAKKISWKDATKLLDGLPPTKIHCSVLAVDTLKSAIKNYELKNNLIEAEAFSKTVAVRELKSIIYPKVGEDIVSLKMVKYVGWENGVLTVDLNVPSFDVYRQNIKEEVIEHLEKYEQIKKIVVNI